MRLVSADGRPLDTIEEFHEAVSASDGRALRTQWSTPGAAQPPIDAELSVHPLFQVLAYAEEVPTGSANYESGLLGLVPLVQIAGLVDDENAGVLLAGDVVLRAGSVPAPRLAQFMQEIARHKRRVIELELLREGQLVTVQAKVSRKGRLGVGVGSAVSVPVVAQPLASVRGRQGMAVPTAAADLELLGGSHVERVGDLEVADWPALRAALRANTRAARDSGEGAAVELTVANPTPGQPRHTMTMELSAEDVRALHELGWTTELPSLVFEPLRVVRSSGGNPVLAIRMGLEETHKTVLLTYLTLDRLVRGSVGVEQLRGPVGIVDLGAKTVRSGLMFLLFFLAVISVNLAVLNFLPLPIVDGGLFLFLIYEKIKGRPPSVAFQNAATLVGVVLIGGLLVVVTWHDIVRLL
jgi:regulator of sigma E protease